MFVGKLDMCYVTEAAFRNKTFLTFCILDQYMCSVHPISCTYLPENEVEEKAVLDSGRNANLSQGHCIYRVMLSTFGPNGWEHMHMEQIWEAAALLIDVSAALAPLRNLEEAVEFAIDTRTRDRHC